MQNQNVDISKIKAPTPPKDLNLKGSLRSKKFRSKHIGKWKNIGKR